MRGFRRKALSAVASLALAVGLCPVPAFGGLQAGSFESGQPGGPGTPLATQSASASGPRVVADSSMECGQLSTWGCVWFGSYPQAEVKSSDPAYAGLQSASWDARGDATVGGSKYRRISKQDATSGDYWPSSSAAYRYFKYEPIKWRVLSVSGSTAFAVADTALDSQRYNSAKASVSWTTSSIRSWLNGYGASSNQSRIGFTSSNFIGAAFTPDEQAAIVPAQAVNGDRVLLLSHSEVSGDAAPALGFSKAVRPDFSDDAHSSWTFEDRMCKGSDFAEAMGALRDNGGHVYWWIRLGRLDASERYADVVGDNGRVYENVGTALVSAYAYAVRPAIHLDLSSPHVTSAGTVSSNGNVDEAASAVQFSDVPPTHWVAGEGWLGYVTGEGLMSGYAGTANFGPDDPLERGQVATILFRYANPGSNATTDASAYAANTTPFGDNASGKYYTAAMNWAYDQGIFTGDASSGYATVRPGDGITRQELGTVLYRFAASRGASGEGASAASYASAPDADRVAEWASEGMGWCFARRVLTGNALTGALDPQGGATRAHMAKMITVVTRDVLG